MRIKLERWPWQIRPGFWANPVGTTGNRWGWKLDCGGMGRFGGGWNWKLGITMGESQCIIDLVLGSIRVTWGKIK